MVLILLSTPDEKRGAQQKMEKRLKASLKRQGVKKVGFRGGHIELELHSNGPGELYFVSKESQGKNGAKRFWNSFGFYDPDSTMQNICVEINAQTSDNSRQVAGFFASCPTSGRTYLMHSGKIGGGKKGVGKAEFSAWLGQGRVRRSVLFDGEIYRDGYVVCALEEEDPAGRIAAFCRDVSAFKLGAQAQSPAFLARVNSGKHSSFSPEYSGTKSHPGVSAYAYETYHGEVVDKLRAWLIRDGFGEANIKNSHFVDLAAWSQGKCETVFEVKTNSGRQTLYTAIGQILTYSSDVKAKRRVLVIPDDAIVPSDIALVLEEQEIDVMRFRRAENRAGSMEVAIVP